MPNVVVRFSLFAALVSCLAAAPARAQDAPPPGSAPPPQPVTISQRGGLAPQLTGISAWGIFEWGGYGLGARYMIPLSIPPLLSHTPLRDTWALEVGADYLHWSYGYLGGPDYSWSEILPVVGMMWTIWVNEQFAFYPKIEAGYAFGWLSDYPGPAGSNPSYGGVFVNGAGGVLYRLASVTLRAEAGYSGLKIGAGFLF